MQQPNLISSWNVYIHGVQIHDPYNAEGAGKNVVEVRNAIFNAILGIQICLTLIREIFYFSQSWPY